MLIYPVTDRRMQTASMKNAGVNVKINETYGTIHGFDMASNSKIVLGSIKKRTEFLKEIFK